MSLILTYDSGVMITFGNALKGKPLSIPFVKWGNTDFTCYRSDWHWIPLCDSAGPH